MKLIDLRSAFGLSLAVLLTACGGGTQADLPVQGTALLQTNVQANVEASVQTAAQPNPAAQVATATMPAPDCAADGCHGLRIIDANAEAFRYQAMQRANAPQT